MKRCVIIGGAPITDYNIIKQYLTDDDYGEDGQLKLESDLQLQEALKQFK